MKKLMKSEILSNTIWTTFGIMGGISYYSKSEYGICGIMFLIGILYASKLFNSISGFNKREVQ